MKFHGLFLSGGNARSQNPYLGPYHTSVFVCISPFGVHTSKVWLEDYTVLVKFL